MQKRNKQTEELRFLADFLRNFMFRNMSAAERRSLFKWKAKGYIKPVVLRPVNTRRKRGTETPNNLLVLPRKEQ